MADGLDELATFVRVVEAGSIAAAARQLEVPKSTVSRRVSRLEERLGVRLLQRTTRSMHTTAEGEALHRRASGPLAELADATAAVADAVDTPRGRLRVTAPVDFGRLLAPVVAEFAAKYPEVAVDVDLSARKVDLIAEGVDLAIRAGTLEDSSLIARKLADVALQLYAAPTYLAERGHPTEPAQLSEHDCILFRASSGTATWQLQGPKREVAVEVRGRISTSELAFARMASLTGLGIVLLPVHMAHPWLCNGELETVLPGWGTRRGAVYLVFPSGRHMPAKVRVFRDHLIESFTPPPWEETERQVRATHR